MVCGLGYADGCDLIVGFGDLLVGCCELRVVGGL